MNIVKEKWEGINCVDVDALTSNILGCGLALWAGTRSILEICPKKSKDTKRSWQDYKREPRLRMWWVSRGALKIVWLHYYGRRRYIGFKDLG